MAVRIEGKPVLPGPIDVELVTESGDTIRRQVNPGSAALADVQGEIAKVRTEHGKITVKTGFDPETGTYQGTIPGRTEVVDDVPSPDMMGLPSLSGLASGAGLAVLAAIAFVLTMLLTGGD